MDGDPETSHLMQIAPLLAGWMVGFLGTSKE